MEEMTLDYYNRNAEEFCRSTEDADMSECYAIFEKYADGSCGRPRVLDLGCGSGRDSAHFLRKGYDVVSVDGAERICALAERYISEEFPGHKVMCRKFDEIDFECEFDGVWACASLLHAGRDEIGGIVEKIAAGLKSGGTVYASFKYGDGQRTKNGRYFYDYNEDSVIDLFCGNGLFEKLECFITGDVRDGRGDEKWINFVGKRML